MKNRVPISELPTVADVDLEAEKNMPLMTWNFELPPSLDAERLTVDTGYLGLIHKIGALSTTSVYSEQGDVSSFDYQINGVNLDGTATMSGREVRTSTARKERNQVGDLGGRVGRELIKNYGKTTTSHVLNKSEIARVVSDERYKSHQPSEKIWAEQLDDVLQSSIRGAARKHLMGRMTRIDLAIEGMQWGWIAMILASDAASNPGSTVTDAVMLPLLNRALWVGVDSMRNKINTGYTLIRERRFSLIRDMQPDRYIALDALTRVGRLIHYEK